MQWNLQCGISKDDEKEENSLRNLFRYQFFFYIVNIA